MGLGDFLTKVDDWIDNTVGSVIPAYGEYVQRDQARIDAERAQRQAAGEHPSFFKRGLNEVRRGVRGDTEMNWALGKGVQQTYRVRGVQAALELPSRSWDSLFITAARAAYVGHQRGQDGGDWGTLFDRDVWSRAWESFGQPEHVTTGQLIASQLNARTDSADARAVYGLDPIAAADAKEIQDAADNTWYGSALGAAADLTASMAIPGLGTAAKIAKASRATKTMPTAKRAEEVAKYFAEHGTTAAGRGTAEETLLGFVGHDIDPASYITQMQKFARATDGMDRVDLMNHLGPMLERSTDSGKATVANLWAEANKLDDATLRDQVKINTLLALQGAENARSALIADYPLLAANMERMTGSPRAIAFATDLRDARLADGESTVSELLERTYGTASHRAEIDALRDALDEATAKAVAARGVRDLVRSTKPTLKDFDAKRLQETRAESLEATRRTAAELKQARADLEGSKRWATGAYKRGEIDDVRDFNINLGEKRQRVADLEAKLSAARSDRDLFHSTPLPGFERLGQWRTELAASRSQVKEADVNVRWNEALINQQKELIRVKTEAGNAVHGQLDLANQRLTDIFNLGETELGTGKIAPTALDRLKGHLRDKIGDDYYFRTGDGNAIVRVVAHPTRAMRNSLAPRARGSISLVEADLGRLQLQDALKRSGVYAPDEIRQAANDFIAAPAARRGSVVDLHQERMLQRQAEGYAKKYAPGDMTPEEALAWAKETTGETVRHFKEGRAHVTKAADEQIDKGNIIVRDPQSGDTLVAFNEGLLRSDLRDSAPFLDPEHFDQAIQQSLHTLKGRGKAAWAGVDSLNEALVTVWKHGVLIRPGLAVRASLDTELRAWSLADTFTNLSTAITGAAHMARNIDERALERVMLGIGKDPGASAVKIMTRDLVPIKVKTGRGVRTQFAASGDIAERDINAMALNKGGSMSQSLQPHVQRQLGKYQVDRNNWDYYAPGSPNWEMAYAEHSQKILASPTARKVARLKFDDPGLDGAAIFDRLKLDEAVRGEYRLVAQPEGLGLDEFFMQVSHEVDNMFPTRDVFNHAKNHQLSKTYLRETFPRELRFEVPGPHLSAIEEKPIVRGINRALNAGYRNFLDKPDMWMSRNPTFANVYRAQVRREAADTLKRVGGRDLTFKEIEMIDKRARLTAISDIRRTFFDTTRWNGAHEKLAKLMPFFAAWEDAMTSWARLIYDDPRRLVKLSAGWNAAGTLNPWMPSPLLIDENGNAVQRGEHPEQLFIAVPFPFGPKGGVMRIRREALNSIAQGEQWWFPGFGPVATVPATALLGRVIPHDVVLSLVGADSGIGKELLKTMFLDGEIPKADAASLGLSFAPGWVRILSRDVFGINMARNTQTGFNKRIADATSRGENPDQKQLRRYFEEAKKDAQAAGIIRLVSSAGFGMTGSAVVDGQFYVDRMHEIEGMTPDALRQQGFDSPEEYFTHLYPEAGGLDWHMARNLGGINATVNAQISATRQNAIIKEYDPAVAWMVLGSDNVGGEFSRTAYNQQVTAGAPRGRVNKTDAEMATEAMAAVGWKRYNNFLIGLKDVAEEAGVSMQSDVIDAAKSAYVQGLAGENSDWYADYVSTSGKRKLYTQQANKMSVDPRLRDRADMVAYRDYVTARQQVYDYYDIQSLSGTAPEYQEARELMNQVGERLSAQNLGFMQMWNRFLSRETEEK